MKEIISKANTNSVKRHDALYTTAYSETWPKGGTKKIKNAVSNCLSFTYFCLVHFCLFMLSAPHTTETGNQNYHKLLS